jgi:hypothetical protein
VLSLGIQPPQNISLNSPQQSSDACLSCVSSEPTKNICSNNDDDIALSSSNICNKSSNESSLFEHAQSNKSKKEKNAEQKAEQQRKRRGSVTLKSKEGDPDAVQKIKERNETDREQHKRKRADTKITDVEIIVKSEQQRKRRGSVTHKSKEGDPDAAQKIKINE